MTDENNDQPRRRRRSRAVGNDPDKLTVNQARFLDHWRVHRNPRAAAEYAEYKNPSQAAYDVMNNKNVQRVVREIQELELKQKIEMAEAMQGFSDAELVIIWIMAVRRDPLDYIDGYDYLGFPEYKALEDLTKLQRRQILSVKPAAFKIGKDTYHTYTEISMIDPIWAHTMLAKTLGTDKLAEVAKMYDQTVSERLDTSISAATISAAVDNASRQRITHDHE